MKVAAAYYLLFFYAAALFKPVLPFVSDFFAHNFAIERHIATIHRQYGAAHVHQEVFEASAHSHTEQKAPEVKFSEPVSVHIISQPVYCFTVRPYCTNYYSSLTRKPSNPLLQVLVPPPKVAASII